MKKRCRKYAVIKTLRRFGSFSHDNIKHFWTISTFWRYASRFRQTMHLYTLQSLLLNAVRCPYIRSYVCNAGRGQLSSEWRHNENDVIMIIVGLYGDWRRVATGCNALVLVWVNKETAHVPPVSPSSRPRIASAIAEDCYILVVLFFLFGRLAVWFLG